MIFCKSFKLFLNRQAIGYNPSYSNEFAVMEGLIVELSEKVVLVTGGNRGLGKAFVEELLNLGVKKVYLGSRKLVAVDDSRVVPVQLDVTNADDIQRIVEELIDLSMIINNAGIREETTIESSDAEATVDRAFTTNVLGTLAVTKAALPALVRNKGIVVNILSVGSWMNTGINLAYGISKAAELSLTNNLRAALNPKGVQVVAVHAGFIDTDMMKGFNGEKLSPNEVARITLEDTFNGKQEVLVDQMAKNAKQFSAAAVLDFDVSQVN